MTCPMYGTVNVKDARSWSRCCAQAAIMSKKASGKVAAVTVPASGV